MKRQNLTGMRNGMLTAISLSEHKNKEGKLKWLCKCDCGNIRFLITSEFKKNKSCGCTHGGNRRENCIKDISGQRFGNLQVVINIGVNKDSRRAIWQCLCDCGKLIETDSKSLIDGYKNSCGCMLQERNYNSAITYLFGQYKKSAKNKHIPFDLTKEDFYILNKGKCKYCDAEPLQILKGKRFVNTNYIYNGIDRVDNKKGYTLDNAVSCCFICNRAKWTMEVDDFIEWLKCVAKKWR